MQTSVQQVRAVSLVVWGSGLQKFVACNNFWNSWKFNPSRSKLTTACRIGFKQWLNPVRSKREL
jgi:hypothetical protein